MNSVQAMTDEFLVKFYKLSMVNSYTDYKHVLGGSLHPIYEYVTVYLEDIKDPQYFNLYHSHIEYLLNEMWERCNNAPLVKQCWWLSSGVFNTKIGYHSTTIQNTSTVETPQNKIKSPLRIYDQDYAYLSQGSKRMVYISPCKTYVLKVSNGESKLGVEENICEAKTYKENPNSIYAKCELIEDTILKMEYVEPAFFTKSDELPKWTLSIAEHQVGYTLDGRLVAYDYGSNI